MANSLQLPQKHCPTSLIYPSPLIKPSTLSTLKSSLHTKTYTVQVISANFFAASMGAHQCLSSLSCEIRIIRAKNIELKTEGKLFVRYYLSAGNNQRVGLNSREISSKSDLLWDESLSLECLGSEESIQSLMQERVVFELRWRSKVPVLGRVCKSHVLGRAEIPWASVFASKEMEIEKWVSMVSTGSRVVDQDSKPPALQVAMKVRIPKVAERRRRVMKWDECGCMDGGCTCVDADHIFALAAALEAL